MSTLTAGDRAFLSIMPAVLRHAEFAFRRTRDPHTFDDRVQETLCLCWTWTRRLWDQGKDARAFPTALARYATRHVKGGRGFVGGKLGRNDALSPLAHAVHGFFAQALPGHENPASPAPWMERLVDQPGSRVAELAAFRIDFPAWLERLTVRDRGMAEEMALGETTRDLASRFGVSPGRVSQKRRDFREGWRSFVSVRA
jgi:DNA-directed RNA polymerase specialized sigma24 family protein